MCVLWCLCVDRLGVGIASLQVGSGCCYPIRRDGDTGRAARETGVYSLQITFCGGARRLPLIRVTNTDTRIAASEPPRRLGRCVAAGDEAGDRYSAREAAGGPFGLLYASHWSMRRSHAAEDAWEVCFTRVTHTQP